MECQWMFRLGAGWYSVKPCDFRITGLCPASAPANYSGRKSNTYTTDLQEAGWPLVDAVGAARPIGKGPRANEIPRHDCGKIAFKRCRRIKKRYRLNPAKRSVQRPD